MPDNSPNPLNLPNGGPANSDYFEQFLLELEAINKTLQATRTELPEQFAAKMKDVAQFYLDGLSKKASQPTSAASSPGLGDSGGSSRGVDPFKVNIPNMTQQQIRQAMSKYSQPTDDELAVQGGSPPRGGNSSKSGGASTPKPAGSSLSDEQFARVNDISNAPALSMLRLADSRYTAQDFLEAAGKGTANRFSANQNAANQMQANSGGVMTQQQAQDYDQAQKRANGWGTATSYLDSAYQKIPIASMANHLMNNMGVTTSPGYYTQSGAQLGGSPDGGNINIPGTSIGIRLPFLNSAAQGGISQEWNIQKLRSQAGINNSQAHDIYNELNARGFTSTMDEGRYGSDQRQGSFLGMGQVDKSERGQTGRNLSPTPSFKSMTDAAATMTKTNPQLVNSTYYDLMDKAVRSASTSLTAFNANMAQVTKVATETGYSMAQLQQDMDDVGNTTVALGGTHFQGQKDAVDFQTLNRGVVPAAKLSSLMQNPWVQSYTNMSTGLMPWQQGLENSGMASLNVNNAVSQLWKSVGPMKGISRNVPGTNIKQNYSSDQLKAAQVSQLMGGDLSPQEILNMQKNQKTVQSRSTLLAAGEAWSKNIGNIQNSDESAGQKKTDMNKLLANLGGKDGGFGEINRLEKAGGFTKKEITSVTDASKGKSGAAAASARYNQIKKVLESKDKANPGDNPNQQTVTVELGPSAKKLLHIQSGSGANKRSAQAAQIPVNSAAGSSLTNDPSAGIYGGQVPEGSIYSGNPSYLTGG